MPAISNNRPSILVTGANGYLGTWIVRHLLERRYSVRAAVRTVEKGVHLRKMVNSYGEDLQLVAVGDMGKPGAFDKAVQGVDGIIHTASPVTLEADDPQRKWMRSGHELIGPAVNGVTGLLESARKFGSTLQRIVVTSSCAAILDSSDKEVTVSEKDWNNARVEECETFGRNANALSKYAASKTVAEQAAWSFVKSHKKTLEWDMVVINPPWIFGPPIHELNGLESLNPSCRIFYNALVENDFMGMEPTERPGHGWVDVRDVAVAHIRALEAPHAGGERIIVSAGEWVWQDIINAALSLPGSIYKPHAAVSGVRNVSSRFITFDTKKEKEILGVQFRTLKEHVFDIFVDYIKRGWY